MISTLLKNAAERLPYSIGLVTKHIPHRIRLGHQYKIFKEDIVRQEFLSEKDKADYTLNHLKKIVKYAQEKFSFYRSLYGDSPVNINSIEDFKRLPVITKEQVREYTNKTTGYMQINTGGTSGNPMSFYVDRHAWAREWAHMHYIWGLRGYQPVDLMVTMLGKDLGNYFYKYNAVHNEIKLNPYMDAGKNAKAVRQLFRKFPIKYFQGYPSSIYNFFREIESSISEQEKYQLFSKIKCCFLSSEYPLPYMTEYLREKWNLNFISWYGHSEMCILAYDENNNGNYTPFNTYGYSEIIDGVLHGTSFHNIDMPLIRYSTGDIVSGDVNQYGLINSFKITEGRTGDFIIDANGKSIPLTALVFGRHHKIFDFADYVQIMQEIPGIATLFVTLKPSEIVCIGSISDFFDFDNIDIQFNFVLIKQPIRTIGGKLKLRLTQNDLKS